MPTFSLNCFADFAEAKTVQKKISIVQAYKTLQEKLSEGMFKYHGPALQALRGRLVQGGLLSDQRAAIAEACLMPKWAEKRNLKRISVNLSVFDTVSSSSLLFPCNVIRREQFLFAGSNEISIRFCPDLSLVGKYGHRFVKLGLRQKPRTSDLIVMMLHIMTSACGLQESADHIVYFDTSKGQASFGSTTSLGTASTIKQICQELSEVWQTC